MEIYRVGPGHVIKDVHRAWLLLVRAECSCGHKTRPYWSLDGAADALLQHQIESGTRVA